MDELDEGGNCKGDEEYEELAAGLGKETRLLMVDGYQCASGGVILVHILCSGRLTICQSQLSCWACVLVPV